MPTSRRKSKEAPQQKLNLGGIVQSVFGQVSSAPVWVIRAGLSAVLISGLSLPLAIARRKVAALTIELNLKKEAEQKAIAQKKLDEEQRTRDLLDKEIEESKLRAMKSVAAITVLEKDMNSVIEAIAKAVTWEDIQTK